MYVLEQRSEARASEYKHVPPALDPARDRRARVQSGGAQERDCRGVIAATARRARDLEQRDGRGRREEQHEKRSERERARPLRRRLRKCAEVEKAGAGGAVGGGTHEQAAAGRIELLYWLASAPLCIPGRGHKRMPWMDDDGAVKHMSIPSASHAGDERMPWMMDDGAVKHMSIPSASIPGRS